MLSASTFPCVSCGEFINTSMAECRFCRAPVDQQAAMSAVEKQEKINSACNGASLIRNLAGAMWLCFFLRFLPFVGLFAGLGLLVLFFLVPIRLVHWQMKYGGIRTADVDYRSAKRNALVALGLWVLMLAAVFVLIVITAGALALSGR